MTSAQFQEAFALTVGGLGTAFLVLILLILLILAMTWVSARRVVQRMTGALAAAEESTGRRNRALAAAIAVSTALAEREVTRRPGAEEDT